MKNGKRKNGYRTRVTSIEIDDEENLRAQIVPYENDASDNQVYLDLTRDDKAADLVRQLKQYVSDYYDEDRAPEVTCKECIARCCMAGAHSEIALTDTDITRLAKHLGWSRQKLIKSKLEKVYTTEDYTYQFAFRQDERADDGWCCPFLDIDKRGQGRCTVYEGRPRVCRDFPAYNCELFIPVERIAGRWRRERYTPPEEVKK